CCCFYLRSTPTIDTEPKNPHVVGARGGFSALAALSVADFPFALTENHVVNVNVAVMMCVCHFIPPFLHLLAKYVSRIC
ncbi:MAG: hypothetical protein LUE15_07850, partial [Oscillospiraceae bacterium]|nr:hypothetical protein [Oscillospiraceae bacterium]